MMMAVESLGGWRFGKKETTAATARTSLIVIAPGLTHFE
jgi:hypothetical protein